MQGCTHVPAACKKVNAEEETDQNVDDAYSAQRLQPLPQRTLFHGCQFGKPPYSGKSKESRGPLQTHCPCGLMCVGITCSISANQTLHHLPGCLFWKACNNVDHEASTCVAFCYLRPTINLSPLVVSVAEEKINKGIEPKQSIHKGRPHLPSLRIHAQKVCNLHGFRLVQVYKGELEKEPCSYVHQQHRYNAGPHLAELVPLQHHKMAARVVHLLVFVIFGFITRSCKVPRAGRW
mmetsp:Transcript_69043/g.152385  ORF Transcript_69043/g.152385 Transcript_69043/m.152385 type:complete len:235 (+) Transcript_69043:1628-2332(+)